jgi:hypothetical protein
LGRSPVRLFGFVFAFVFAFGISMASTCSPVRLAECRGGQSVCGP